MNLTKEMNHFYYKMALYELELMNHDALFEGISYHSLLYLNVISQMEECTVSKLANALHVTKSAVTLKINELEKQNRIYKQASKEDKRVQYIYLEETFEKLMDMYDYIFAKVESSLHDTFTEQELQTFGNVLNAITGMGWKEVIDE